MRLDAGASGLRLNDAETTPMPDSSPPKRQYQPGRGSSTKGLMVARRPGPCYAELHCRTNFSFLQGASHADELVQRAAELDYGALAITDRNSLAGVVRAHVAAKDAGVKLLIGAEITPVDAAPAVLLATDRAAYGRLARLITRGRRSAPKGECYLTFDDVAEHAEGLLACVPTQHSPSDCLPLLRYRDVFSDRCYALAELHRGPHDQWLLDQMIQAANQAGVPLAAANDVHYHKPDRRFLQDVLTAIRHGCSVAELGSRLFPNGERYLKSPIQMAELFAECPDAIARTAEVAARCQFSLDELCYEYPEEAVQPIPGDGSSVRPLPPATPIQHLVRLTWEGARKRYPQGVPETIRRLIEHELLLIEELHYESYFLTVWDLVRFARSRDILCQGRGSAANSAVCYCLGVTSVNPDRIDVLFERFVSKERDEAPDIDVDFEHERREEVIQYIYGKYGRERAGMTAEVITYRPRSAVRDVGKALGLSLDCVDTLAKSLEHYHEQDLADRLPEAGLNPTSRTGRQLMTLTEQILGFPRHLSQHVGGMVITQGPLCELVPIENAAMPDRTVIEWDKDDLDALGILKVDCLALGMLTAIHKCFDLINTPPRPLADTLSFPLTLATVPPEDPAVYEMVSRADTVGVFQIESRAQMSMLPRLRPQCFYDLVIEVAIVRPGPIQGDMVHPYLRRRSGREPVKFPDERIKAVLGKTLGVPIFQEQAMRLAVVAAGFTPGEADQLRRAMGAWRRRGTIEQFRQKLINGIRANGYSAKFGERLFQQIRGFGEYGFPESHAASFALLVYVSAWLKRYHPAAFTVALLNSQPMGFYAPAQLIADARRHGVEVRSVDVNFSCWDCTLESATASATVEAGTVETPSSDAVPLPPAVAHERRDEFALRLGFRMVKGLSRSHVESIVECRAGRPFRSLDDFVCRSGLNKSVVTRLAKADTFRSFDLNRRSALWQSLSCEKRGRDSFSAKADTVEESRSAPSFLPRMSPLEEVVADYQTGGLSLRDHPLKFLRPILDERRAVRAGELAALPADRRVTVGGLVLLRQRPSTASGITFVTLEDETGLVNLIVRHTTWERYRRVARSADAMLAHGRLQRQDEVIHVLVDKLEDLSALLTGVETTSRDFR